jgi:predicted acetyltransferase
MSMDTHLILPSVAMDQTYREFIAEVKHHGERLTPWVLAMEAPTFEELIQKLEQYSQGIGLQSGFVPHSTFWLIDDDKNLLGVSNLRHELTPSLELIGGHIGFGVRPSQRGKGLGSRLMAMTLLEAKRLGMDRLLLTCDRQNRASARVIEKNGGVLDCEVSLDDGNVTRRYWIDLNLCDQMT